MQTVNCSNQCCHVKKIKFTRYKLKKSAGLYFFHQAFLFLIKIRFFYLKSATSYDNKLEKLIKQRHLTTQIKCFAIIKRVNKKFLLGLANKIIIM